MCFSDLCVDEVSYAAAKFICETDGARICTALELQLGAGTDTGKFTTYCLGTSPPGHHGKD